MNDLNFYKPKLLKKALASFALSGLAFGALQGSNAQAGVFPGEDPSLAVLPGQGLNTITREALGNCVNIGNFRTQSGNETGQIAESWIEEMVNINQMIKSLRIDASAYMGAVGGVGGGDQGGTLGFVDSVSKNSVHRYLLIKSRLGNQLEIGSDFSFTPSVEQFLAGGGSPSAFFSHCGNEFIYSTRTGSEVITVIEFLIKSNAQDKKFSLILQNLQYQQWIGNFALINELKKFEGTADTKVYMARKGGQGALPHVEKLEDFIKEYPHIIDVSLTDPVALEIVGKTYGGVQPLNLVPDDSTMREKDYAISEIAARHAESSDALSSIRFVTANLKDFKYDPKVHDLAAQERAFMNYQRELASVGRACVTGVWSLCALPSTPMPVTNLPERKK